MLSKIWYDVVAVIWVSDFIDDDKNFMMPKKEISAGFYLKLLRRYEVVECIYALVNRVSNRIGSVVSCLEHSSN